MKKKYFIKMTFPMVLLLIFSPIGGIKTTADINGSNFSGNGKITFYDKSQGEKAKDSIIINEKPLPQTSNQASPLTSLIGIGIILAICFRYSINKEKS